MNEPIDLETTIADAVNDAQISDVETDTSVPEVEAVSEVPETPPLEATEAVETTPDADATESHQVSSPAAKNEPQDEFERLAGMAEMGVAGRENRIPYSRVKKITEKAVNDVAEAALGRKLNPGEKAVDVVKAHVADLPELRTKVTDYESRLDKVGEFENVMANQPDRFLDILSRLPAYKEFFDFVRAAASQQENPAQPAQPIAAQPPLPTGDEMPEPNEELPDGTKVYNMEGLKGLLAWNAKQVETRVSKQFEDRYKPMESDWQERRRLEVTLPIVRAKIAEAKTWPLFNESEEEITRVLEGDPNISLDAAYHKVVFPKLVAERNTMRQSILQEVKTAPTSTSVPTRVATRPVAPAPGPQSLEDIIKESLQTIKR